MFDYTLLHWTSFLSAALILNLSPGPDFAFIFGQTLRGGKRAGFAAMFGIWTGAMVHVGLAAVGLSAILATSAVAFSIVKYIGAAYLVWLGLSALRAKQPSFLDPSVPSSDSSSLWPIFRQGVLNDILNPKVALFFLAFLPQFIVEGQGPVPAQFLLHGVMIIVTAAVVEPPLILLGDRLANRLRRSARIALWMERTVGAILVALGIRLALQPR